MKRIYSQFIDTLKRRRAAKEIVCPSCNKIRLVTIENLARMKSLFCSTCVRHFQPKHKTGFYRACARCGKSFWVFPANKDHAVYCSKECQSYIKPRPCKFCGKSFKPKRDSAKFCSGHCYHSSTIKQITKTCERCHKIFLVIPCRKDARFCSMKCRVLSGTSNPNYRNGKYVGNSHPYPYGGKWPSIRKWILDRDNHTCQVQNCQSSSVLQVHHKNRFDDKFNKDEQNNPDNLITLCRKHHWDLHRHRAK